MPMWPPGGVQPPPADPTAVRRWHGLPVRGLVAGAVVLVLMVLGGVFVAAKQNDPPPRSARYYEDLDACRRDADIRFTPRSHDWRTAITVCMVLKGYGEDDRN